MMPGKKRIYDRVGKRNLQSTDGQVTTFVVVSVRLARTERISRVDQGQIIYEEKVRKVTGGTVPLPGRVLGSTGPPPQIHVYPEPRNVT